MNNQLTALLLISIYKNVLKNKIVELFISFLDVLLSSDNNFERDLRAYSDFINAFYVTSGTQNFYDYVSNLIYTDENIISKGCSDCIKDNEQLLSTASYELSLLYNLLSFDFNKIKSLFEKKYPDKTDLIAHLPAFTLSRLKEFNIEDIIKSYSKNGYGIFACYSAFKYLADNSIKPVKYFDNLTFSDLKNYDYQQKIIKQNTLAFLENKPANNILLYGDRGCGKSSTVKALINEFSNYNLKIIQVDKNSFIQLQSLYEKIRNLPLKFVIFADDISFDEDDKNFSEVKAALEGSVSAAPKNTVIYATSNRMHLVKESFSAREGNEVHFNDTIDEIVSLSDRFGIMLTFSSLNKNEYLDIVKQIANDCCVNVDDKLLSSAMTFSMQKGIMTPRIARQFINDFIANLAL